MSDDPNDRAARLAGRWGDEDASEEGEVAAEATVGDSVGDESSGSEPNDGADPTPDDAEEGARAGPEEEGDDDNDEGGRVDDDGGDERRDDDDRGLTTREMQSQMLYLPPEFHKEVDLTFEELNLRFRRERDRKLEKNRDFYLGLLQLGLAELGDVGDRELDEVEELLDL